MSENDAGTTGMVSESTLEAQREISQRLQAQVDELRERLEASESRRRDAEERAGDLSDALRRKTEAHAANVDELKIAEREISKLRGQVRELESALSTQPSDVIDPFLIPEAPGFVSITKTADREVRGRVIPGTGTLIEVVMASRAGLAVSHVFVPGTNITEEGQIVAGVAMIPPAPAKK